MIIIMKKIIFAAVAVISALTLAACSSGTPVNQNTVEPSVKKKDSYEMTAEKASGKYVLVSMDEVGSGDLVTNKDSYTENSITLNADGTFDFIAAVSDENKEETAGTYEIAPNGVITFSGDFSIAAKDETVVCDGEKLSADGTVGKLAFTMNYEKEDEKSEESKEEKEEQPEADTSSDDETTENE